MTFGPLISAATLTKELAAPDLRLADCRFSLDDVVRGRLRYDVGHIPGAVYLSLEDDLSGEAGAGRHPLPSPAALAERLGSHGIGDGCRLVAYDDAGGAFAARLWWMLRALGHDNVAVLDGGIDRWVAGGGPLTAEVGDVETATLTLAPTYHGVVDYDAVAAGTAGMLIDARAPARYRGEIEPIDPIAGHIPGAIHLPYALNLDDGSFASAEALAARYRAAGLDNASDAVVYCGSGVTACHDILAMEVAGLGWATLYPGSWSDWAAHQTAG